MFQLVSETYRYVQVAVVRGAIAECGDSSYPGTAIFLLPQCCQLICLKLSVAVCGLASWALVHKQKYSSKCRFSVMSNHLPQI